jgi:signal transduction histidine kinase
VVKSVNDLEKTMMATLVGHEVAELVTTLTTDPDAELPQTAHVNAYLRSREQLIPIPDFLEALAPNDYPHIQHGGETYHVTILDMGDDRLYLAFETSNIAKSRALLIYQLVSGGVLATVVLMISGVWLSRKFLLPISHLAGDISSLDINNMETRLEEKYKDYEVGLIARSTDQFLEKLDEFVEREQFFTTAASHELRSPIAVFTSSIDLLEFKGLNADQQKVVYRMKEAAEYMTKVIESLLFLARSNHDLVDKTKPEIDLQSTVLNIARTFETMATERRLDLKCTAQNKLKARMIGTHLEIILTNLIRNAINNTSEGTIEVILFENRLSVKDTGHGIEADKIKLVGTRNYHSSDSTGLGLGLFLVSKICDIYDMEFQIDSTVGEGSEFTVVFPPEMIWNDPD